jgi:RNA polymerase sigma-70 factor (ECF subfamily)
MPQPITPLLRLVRDSADPPETPVAPQPPTLEQAFRAHAQYVVAVATRLLGRDEEVNDLVQDVFLTAMRDLPSLRDPSSLRSWLAAITARKAHDRLRKRRLRAFLSLDAAPDYQQLADDAASPEQKALLARVYTVLDQIPARDRIAWTLRHVEGQQLEEVAGICGCSLATAKRRISAAQERIERAFADE